MSSTTSSSNYSSVDRDVCDEPPSAYSLFQSCTPSPQDMLGGGMSLLIPPQTVLGGGGTTNTSSSPSPERPSSTVDLDSISACGAAEDRRVGAGVDMTPTCALSTRYPSLENTEIIRLSHEGRQEAFLLENGLLKLGTVKEKLACQHVQFFIGNMWVAVHSDERGFVPVRFRHNTFLHVRGEKVVAAVGAGAGVGTGQTSRPSHHNSHSNLSSLTIGRNNNHSPDTPIPTLSCLPSGHHVAYRHRNSMSNSIMSSGGNNNNADYPGSLWYHDNNNRR